MLDQESVFEDQIHELHRLYQTQKELMMEMEETSNLYSQPQHLFLNAGVSGPRMSSSISKIGDIWEEKEGSKNGEAHNFPKGQSPRSMSLESVVQGESVHHLTDSSMFKSILELNEPAKIENGNDLNMSPLSSKEEVTIIKTKDSEQPRELVSASLQGKHRELVLALPSSKNISLFYKPRSWSRKKSKRGTKSTTVKTFTRSKARKGSDIDTALDIPESDHNKEFQEKESLSSLLEVKLARNCTNTGKRSCCKPHIESDKVVKKTRRTKLKITGSFLVTEHAAADAIGDMSLSDSDRKASNETSDCITPLHWFAKIASSVVEDSKSKFGLSLTGYHSNFEEMTLQFPEMVAEEQRTNITVSNTVPPKHKRTAKQPDVQKIGRLIEASERNDAHSSYNSVIENMVFDWGTKRKRRRCIRNAVANTKTSTAFLRN